MEIEERLPRRARDLLRHFGLRAKKSLGQHFLIDKQVLRCIVSASKLTREDTVIEIGPGLGILTTELARQAKQVIAVETDTKLASALSEVIGAFPNISVINSDILQTNPASLLAAGSAELDELSYKVVANIPYYITAPILRHFLEASPKPSLIVVMVQKEVGKAIIAQPGEMSLLAVSVQFYGKPKIIDYVSAQSFYPPPKVDSAILQIEIYKQPLVRVDDNDKFFEVVRAGFSSPRKQLRNSLAQGVGIAPQVATNLIAGAGINSRLRAEALNLQEWARLYEAVRDYG
ncbi:16S rRNA (adenine(1518)-N(6)/adenine(1519)-N(6))-dimethyltransferase RsmA [Chloroflexota bacterium]